MLNDIYRYTNAFDRNIICDRIADIEDRIQEEEEKEESDVKEANIRNLMYEQLIQGMRLCTDYRYF